ncbi:MAG: GNAT family N-acetyltransferase, partial [Cystobacter sp.]
MTTWTWKAFTELTPDELYALLALRQRVFVLEQRCLYPDIDGHDRAAHHLLGLEESRLIAYLRVLPPHTRTPELSLGRVVTAPEARAQGLGRLLVQRGIDFIAERFPGAPIHIGAQNHLRRFYESLGFRAAGDVYDEDGIP